MPSRRIATDLNSGTYYLTLTVQRWYYLFDRFDRWQILADSCAGRGLQPRPEPFNHVPS